MLRRSMHAWRSTWLLHTRAVLLQVVLVSELARSLACSLHLRHLFLLPKHLHSQDAMLIDGVTTKPRLKQAGIDATPRVRANSEQSAAGRWLQLIPTNLSGSLATRFFFFYFPPSHFCCCGRICMHQHSSAYLMAQQPNLPVCKSTKPKAVPVHLPYLWTFRSKRNL